MNPSPQPLSVNRPWGAIAAFGIVFIAVAAAAALANSYYVDVIGRMVLAAIVGVGLNVLIGLTGQVSFGHVGFYAIGAYTVAILTTKAGFPFIAASAPSGTAAMKGKPALVVRMATVYAPIA